MKGRVTKKIWRVPADKVERNSAILPVAPSRESVGKSTVPIATANMPCGSWKSRNALSMTAGAVSLM